MAAGWGRRELADVFDAPDDRAASTHYLSLVGHPLYDAERVAVAEYRTGRASEPPSAPVWSHWRDSLRPTSPPLYTLGLDQIIRGAALDGGPRRPPFGSRWSTNRIRSLLTALIARVTGDLCASWDDAEQVLESRATVLALVGNLPAAGDVVVRPVTVSGYLSTASSAKALGRGLDFLSLIHVGHLLPPSRERTAVPELLVRWPDLRLDSRLLEAKGSRVSPGF